MISYQGGQEPVVRPRGKRRRNELRSRDVEELARELRDRILKWTGYAIGNPMNLTMVGATLQITPRCVRSRRRSVSALSSAKLR
jgi:hypothetical protein